jgi:hypothetical protein
LFDHAADAYNSGKGVHDAVTYLPDGKFIPDLAAATGANENDGFFSAAQGAWNNLFSTFVSKLPSTSAAMNNAGNVISNTWVRNTYYYGAVKAGLQAGRTVQHQNNNKNLALWVMNACQSPDPAVRDKCAGVLEYQRQQGIQIQQQSVKDGWGRNYGN